MIYDLGWANHSTSIWLWLFTIYLFTYIVVSFFAELSSNLKDYENRYEENPSQGILQFLNVDDTKDEDDFVENQVPELIFDIFLLWGTKVSKHSLLYWVTQEN